MPVYSKDSFDRFGDDLCELLFSYLSFEEKLRKESVSKQWQRLVFNKQNELCIEIENKDWKVYCKDRTPVNSKRLERILMKCQFIESIRVDENVRNRDTVFQLIIKYCNHLTHISSDFNGLPEKTFKEFFHKFGTKLKSIGFHTDVKRNRDALIECQNLRSVDIKPVLFVYGRKVELKNISLIFNKNFVIVNNLKHISFNYSFKDSDRIRIFVANVKHSLEFLKLGFNYEEENAFLPEDKNTKKQLLFNELAKLSKLKALNIDYSFAMEPDEILVNFLIQLSNNCPDLKKIRLNVRKQCDEVFRAINRFKKLKRLSIQLSTHENIEYSYSCVALDELKNLTHLTIKDDINDDFFDNIHIHLPKLQHIYCPTHNALSIRILEPLSKLSDLRSIGLYAMGSKSEINKSIVFDLIEKRPKIIGFKNDYIECNENEDNGQEVDQNMRQEVEESGDENEEKSILVFDY